MHFRKLTNTFYKEYLEKLIAISLFLDSISLKTGLIVPKELKKKCGYPSKEVNKRGRK